MADREKLIEIFSGYNIDPPCDTCKTPIGHCKECGKDRLADHLIANGVTVRERGRWIMKETMIRSPFAKNAYCSECLEETGYAHNFCPNCGADMRGEEDA